jgi:hypothetical protein
MQAKAAERELESRTLPKPRVLKSFFGWPSLSRCVPIALFVGTVLSLVNQGAVIFGGHANYLKWIRVCTNYLTPFCVSSIGFFSSQRAVWREKTRK